MSIDRYKKQFGHMDDKLPEGVITFTCDGSNFGLVRLKCRTDDQALASAEAIIRMLQMAHEIGLHQGQRLAPKELDDKKRSRR
ncbi:hypothetical protein JXA47_16605 [Candidatus Sumerlaeota bacterium]|nr:hypothetical protein [Candidatus Sumerlaeota bacterium]